MFRGCVINGDCIFLVEVLTNSKVIITLKLIRQFPVDAIRAYFFCVIPIIQSRSSSNGNCNHRIIPDHNKLKTEYVKRCYHVANETMYRNFQNNTIRKREIAL